MRKSNNLDNLISESIHKYTLRKQVRAIVSEEVKRYINFRINEKENKKGKGKVSPKMRETIKSWLTGKTGDNLLYSQLSYTLWPDMSEDAARSYFSKKANGDREWTEDEILKLYQIMNKM